VKPGVNLWSRVLIYNHSTRERERERERERDFIISKQSVNIHFAEYFSTVQNAGNWDKFTMVT